MEAISIMIQNFLGLDITTLPAGKQASKFLLFTEHYDQPGVSQIVIG
jgi:hypothetical protein